MNTENKKGTTKTIAGQVSKNAHKKFTLIKLQLETDNVHTLETLIDIAYDLIIKEEDQTAWTNTKNK